MITSKSIWPNNIYNFVSILLQTIGFIFVLIQIFDFFEILGYESIEDLGLFLIPATLILTILVWILKSKNGVKYKIEPEVLKMDKDFSDSFVTQLEINNAKELIERWENREITSEHSKYYASKYRCESYLKEAEEFNNQLQGFVDLEGSFYALNFAITNNSPLFDEKVHFSFRPKQKYEKDDFQIIPDYHKLTGKPLLGPESNDDYVSRAQRLLERKPNAFQRFIIVGEAGIDFEYIDFRGETIHHVFNILSEVVLFTKLKKVQLEVQVNSKLKSKWLKQIVWLDFENTKHVKDRFN